MTIKLRLNSFFYDIQKWKISDICRKEDFNLINLALIDFILSFILQFQFRKIFNLNVTFKFSVDFMLCCNIILSYVR
jgi:hypothetical protein